MSDSDFTIGVVLDEVVFPQPLTRWAGRVGCRLLRVADAPRGLDLLLELGEQLDRGRRMSEAALRRGIPVITANTGVVAAHGPDLTLLANRTGTAFRFAPAVSRAVPEIDRLMAWSRDRQVLRFETALSEQARKRLGRLEQSPFRQDPHSTAEVAHLDGSYCAQALAALGQLVWRRDIRASHVFRLPATRLTPTDIRVAASQSERWCLLGVATAEGCARVEASRLPTDHVLLGQAGPAVVATASSGASALFSADPEGGWTRVLDSVTREVATFMDRPKCSQAPRDGGGQLTQPDAPVEGARSTSVSCIPSPKDAVVTGYAT